MASSGHPQLLTQPLFPSLCSASGLDMGKIEEMEKMLREAHAEKSRLMESRVRLTWRRQRQRVWEPGWPSLT